ncbi:MAG: hypothetical protein AB7O28_01200 [Vicinamibacterales bacterium]
MSDDRLIVLGLSEPTLTMILDNLESRGRFPRIDVVNNMARTDLQPFANPRFAITVVEGWPEAVGPAAAFLGVNQPGSKRAVLGLFASRELPFTTIVHASAAISSTARLAAGVHVNSLVSVAAHAVLGRFVSLNRHVSIGHHARLGEFVTVNPGANVAGYTTIGAGTLIGMGANVVDGVTIGPDTVVCAGAVVTRDLPGGVVARGNPCRVVRARSAPQAATAS